MTESTLEAGLQPAGFSLLPELLYREVHADPAPNAGLIIKNQALWSALDLPDVPESELAQYFGGKSTKPGIAMAYSGHQFGHLVPLLGDGRALLLGEARDYEIQLKGSGRTPFSRGGDGRSALGPVLREYLVSEAMNALGVPTTRSLAALTTGAPVLRDKPGPGAILVRVSKSHVRVGTVYFLALQGEVQALAQLVEFVGRRLGLHKKSSSLEIFEEVVQRQADLIAHWMALGFIHGVMNTDNVSLVGETIDYGPCAFLDEFNRTKVFSSIDQAGRYAFDQQPVIATWNLARLAEALLLIDDRQDDFIAVLETFSQRFESSYQRIMLQRLGFPASAKPQPELIELWLTALQDEGLDYHNSFHQLLGQYDSDDALGFGLFTARWRDALRAENITGLVVDKQLRAHNPRVIPRNHRIEQAIVAAEAGDYKLFYALADALQQPFEVPADMPELSDAPAPNERVLRTFCGT